MIKVKSPVPFLLQPIIFFNEETAIYRPEYRLLIISELVIRKIALTMECI
jgi:hypothetical protein